MRVPQLLLVNSKIFGSFRSNNYDVITKRTNFPQTLCPKLNAAGTLKGETIDSKFNLPVHEETT